MTTHLQLGISEEDNRFRVSLDHDGETREIQVDPHDGSKQNRRHAIDQLTQALVYSIRRKVFPDDTRIYQRETTEHGTKTTCAGYPDEEVTNPNG